jgi:hypothetical protein
VKRPVDRNSVRGKLEENTGHVRSTHFDFEYSGGWALGKLRLERKDRPEDACVLQFLCAVLSPWPPPLVLRILVVRA